jgi:hypothetical protein
MTICALQLSKYVTSQMRLMAFGVLLFMASTSHAAFETQPVQAELKQSTRVYAQPIDGYDSAASTSDIEIGSGLTNGMFNSKLVLWGRADTPYSVAADVRPARFFLEAKEGWIEALGDNWDLRVGNQIISWGSSDLVAPTDVWNSIDFLDPFEPVKVPLALAKLSIHPLAAEHFILDLIASPQFRPNQLPIDIYEGRGKSSPFAITDSRWLIPSPSLARLSKDTVVPLTYQITGADFPQEWQAGARLRMVRLAGWDLAFSYSETTLSMPVFETRLKGNINNPSLPIEITLVPIFYRVSTIGFGASGAMGPFGIRLDVAERTALTETQSTAVPKKTHLSILGVDTSFSVRKSEIYLNLIFALKEDVGLAGPTTTTVGVPNFEPWDRNLILLAEFRYSTSTKIGVRAVASLIHQDGWISPFASTVFAEKLTVELGFDSFVGSTTGAYGQYQDNNRFRSLLSLGF